jgi:tRNA 2-thiouridine synthesizing protein A
LPTLVNSVEHNLDLSGYNCPIPVLKTKKFLSEIAPGDLVSVITTDPASKLDLEDFCVKTGNILLKQTLCQGVITSIIQKRSSL